MELDEFKGHWKKMQDQQAEQLKHNTKTLEVIIMKTIVTFNEIQRKNAFWNSLAKVICPMLIVVLLIELVLSYFVPRTPAYHSFDSIPWVAIMILFAVVTLWLSKRLEQIFYIDPNKSLKESIQATIKDFKSYYRLYNLVYAVLFPAYYYAMIKVLFNIFLKLSETNILWTVAGLSVATFIFNYFYYKFKYFKKLQLMEQNLAELE